MAMNSVPFERSGGVLVRQCSSEFFLWLLELDLSPVRKEVCSTALAQLQLLWGYYTNMTLSWLCQKVYAHPWKAGLHGRVI